MEERGCSATAFSHSPGKVAGTSFATSPPRLSVAVLPAAYCLRTRFSKTTQTLKDACVCPEVFKIVLSNYVPYSLGSCPISVQPQASQMPLKSGP